MRTIKFRGKCAASSKYAGKWAHGGLVIPEQIKDDEVLIVSALSDSCTSTCHVDMNTVGQFTGFHDKDGNEIYEGDIIITDDSQLTKDGKAEYLGVVEWAESNGQWRAILYPSKESDGDGSLAGFPTLLFEAFFEYYKVVGNIHDNLDLIKDYDPD